MMILFHEINNNGIVLFVCCCFFPKDSLKWAGPILGMVDQREPETESSQPAIEEDILK